MGTIGFEEFLSKLGSDEPSLNYPGIIDLDCIKDYRDSLIDVRWAGYWLIFEFSFGCYVLEPGYKYIYRLED